MEWKQTDSIVGKKFAGYWKKGYPKIDQVTWKPVLENNTRASMLQTGEADFAYTLPYEQAALLKKVDKIEVVSSPSIIVRFLAMNVLQSPTTTPGAPGHRLRDQQEALARWPSVVLPSQPALCPQHSSTASRWSRFPTTCKSA